MSSTRNTILTAFKNVIDGMAAGAFGQPSAVIGLLKPKDISGGGGPRVEVWWHDDFGSHVELQSERKLRVVTSVKFKYDASDKTDRGATQLEQASELYDAIHAAIETAYNNRGGTGEDATAFSGLGQFKLVQDEPGIQCMGFDDKDEYMTIGEVWVVTYRRTEGGT